jgi:hypothetical protein
LPVYNGADLVAKALDSLQRQTFKNFEAIISVDGNDTVTAAACRPFLADPRFHMIVHPNRLDWVGNFNWLLQRNLCEFFCYRQHDDTTAPEFFDTLLRHANKEPNAAAIYCDCQLTGLTNHLEFVPSIQGEPLDRMFQYIDGLSWAVPVRGLVRREAIRQAGPVRSGEFRAPFEVFVWLAKLLRWGTFRRVAKPLYYRLDHPRSFSSDSARLSEDRKRAASIALFTGLLEAALPICRTPEERLFFEETTFHKIASWMRLEPNSSQQLMEKCLERLKSEGNAHLVRIEEVPAIIRGFHLRKESEQSRMRKVIYRMHQQSQLASFIYPNSPIRSVMHQFRALHNRIRKKLVLLFSR